MRRLCCLLLFSLTVSPVWADITYERMAELTDSPAELSGSFKQQKYLSDFETHINSSGEFHYQRDQAIQWNTLSPIKNELQLTPDGITSKQGKKQLSALKSADHQAIKQINDIFFAVLTAQWDQLANYFELSGQETDGAWQITLTPKHASLQQGFQRLELSGDRLLRQAKMIEKNGDSTHIRFDNLTQ